MAEEIRAMFIFEVLGRPPEHIKKGLGDFIDKLGENKGVCIINKKVHEPKPVERKDKNGETKIIENFFSTFAEVELKVEDLNLIFQIVLNMLPSHVEIIEPEELRLKNFDLSGALSELTIKLHKYDEVAKAIILEKNNLVRKIQELEKKIKELESNKGNKIEVEDKGNEKINDKVDKIKKSKPKTSKKKKES